MGAARSGDGGRVGAAVGWRRAATVAVVAAGFGWSLAAGCAGRPAPAQPSTIPEVQPQIPEVRIQIPEGTPGIPELAPGLPVVRPPIPEVTPIPDGARCAFTTRSTLPGVRLRFPPQPCSFDVDRVRRAELRWEIVVEAAPGELVHTSTRACPPSGAGGFIAEAVVRGGDQRYCLCDTGLCPPGRRVSAPGPGVYPGSLAWDGRAWEGPSDFGNPKGAPFPPGRHTLEVVARGTRDGAPWEVAGTLEITLTTSTPAPAPRPSPQPAPRPKPAPPDPPVKPDLSSPEATRCETSADCQISCAMSCCGAPCGCRTALNVATARAAEAWGTRDCPPERDCPEVACAYQPAMGAECVRGVCRAIDGLGGGW